MRSCLLSVILSVGVGLAGCDTGPAPDRPDEGTTGTGGGTMNNPGGPGSPSASDQAGKASDSPQGTTPSQIGSPQAAGTGVSTATPAGGVSGSGTGTATPATSP